MDKKENDNVYDNYIDSAILNDNEVQKNNYDRDNCYQEYENILDKVESLVENYDNCYSSYTSEKINYTRRK